MIGSYRDIILAPVITEKAAMIAANGDKIVFKVKKDANKTQIKQAIEKIYNVKYGHDLFDNNFEWYRVPYTFPVPLTDR